MWILLTLLFLGAGTLVFRFWLSKREHMKLLSSELPEYQLAIIERSVPIVGRLPNELRRKLEGKVNVFLHQIKFIGCNGLEVTEEMQLSIAAQASLLVVNTDTWYQNLRTIFIYPNAFKSRRSEFHGHIVTERETIRIGESWTRGPVILSWADVKHGAAHDRDGINVVFHEFAHQIDDLSGHVNGIPVLNKDQSYADWARVFVDAYERHVRNVGNGHRTVFDSYGAVGPDEFFAVAVEVFFEKPASLKHEEAEIYQQLVKLFRLDPICWR